MYEKFYAFPGERIGAQPVLPYLSPELTAQRLLNGANFASAGIGILNDTGFQFVSVKQWPGFFFHQVAADIIFFIV